MSDVSELFPGWAPVWRRDTAIASLLAAANDIHDRRDPMRHARPRLKLEGELTRWCMAYAIACINECVGTSLTRDKAYNSHVYAIRALQPAAHGGFRVRWWYLECALESASQSGDLLFAAVVLRTMLEDVWAVSELARLESLLDLPAGRQPNEDDIMRIERHSDLLWQRYLPLIDGIEAPLGSSTIDPFSGGSATEASLRLHFQQLNDYVHPNYGSHMLALFPETAAAPKVLIDAYLAIYAALDQLNWEVVYNGAPEAFSIPATTPSCLDEMRYFRETTLPDILLDITAAEPACSETYEATNLVRWIEIEENGPEEVLDDQPEWIEPLSELISAVLENGAASPGASSLPFRRADLGFPPPWAVLLLTATRRLSLNLDSEFPNGAPRSDAPLSDRVRFLALAIELAYTATFYKMELLRVALLRQLNARNSIGSMLAMRSLLEHQAIAQSLASRLLRRWGDLRKRSTGGDVSEGHLLEIGGDIASLLTGTKGTVEDQTVWKAGYARASRSKPRKPGARG